MLFELHEAPDCLVPDMHDAVPQQLVAEILPSTHSECDTPLSTSHGELLSPKLQELISTPTQHQQQQQLTSSPTSSLEDISWFIPEQELSNISLDDTYHKLTSPKEMMQIIDDFKHDIKTSNDPYINSKQENNGKAVSKSKDYTKKKTTHSSTSHKDEVSPVPLRSRSRRQRPLSWRLSDQNLESKVSPIKRPKPSNPDAKLLHNQELKYKPRSDSDVINELKVEAAKRAHEYKIKNKYQDPTKDLDFTKSPTNSQKTECQTALPPDHRPARGRGRRKQLQEMTDAQKREEQALRAEKARIAARDGRLRRKLATELLADKVQRLIHKDLESQHTIATLRARIHHLELESAHHRHHCRLHPLPTTATSTSATVTPVGVATTTSHTPTVTSMNTTTTAKKLTAKPDRKKKRNTQQKS